MPWDTRTWSDADYQKHRRDVDYWMLALAAQDGGTSAHELGKKLFHLGIGDAVGDGKLQLAYSLTGVIVRTAIRAGREDGILAKWEETPIGRIKITPAGVAKLEGMKGES